jgi:cytochrome o ubiquinol oxidase subunit 3
MQSVAHQQSQERTLFGFWVYLMTDCVLFASLFAAYAVLHKNTAGGPSTHDLFDIKYALIETIILLVSSFTSGLAMLGASPATKKRLLGWFAVTFLLGASFVGMELAEFASFIRAGNSWERSAFLSSFFTLVATHGTHITIGLIWMIVLLVPVMRHGLTPVSLKRLTCLRLFLHFLDVVWIFIFTLVYLMGGSNGT